MLKTVIFTGLGYIFGSLLFARYFGLLFKNKNIISDSPDNNPGAFNAFRYGGFACGVLTLCCDLLKGFLPVFLYLYHCDNPPGISLAFVFAAPVFGHILPIFHKFQGGKGIAVSFGCLLGLLPEFRPVVILASSFLFFTLILKVTPHYYCTLLTYCTSIIAMLFFIPSTPLCLGFSMVAGIIILKLLRSPEKKEKCKVKLL